MSPTDLEAYGIFEGKQITLNFKRGITVTGEIITGKRNLQGKIILISFKNCTVKYGDEILFQPEWGIYDMAVGANIVSAYSGIADPDNYGLTYEAPKEKTHKIVYSKEDKETHNRYQIVRDMRENNEIDLTILESIFNNIKESDVEWILGLEIYELLYKTNNSFKVEVLDYLNKYKNGEFGNLISDGLMLMED